MLNYIKISGTARGTTGIITLIESSDLSIVADAIEYSELLNTSNSTTSTSHEESTIVISEMEKYVSESLCVTNYEISEDGKKISW